MSVPMSLDEATRERIASLVKDNRVLLFMKGTRSFPQCGFSATVVGILDQIIPGDYQTVNVLTDPAIREGVKAFSDWPTIPQLYVNGEFVGGCDIVKEMFAGGDLHSALGVEVEAADPPTITITDAAAKSLQGALAEAGPGESIHVMVDGRWQHGLDVGAKGANDLEVESNGIKLFVAPTMAKRLNGLTIDFVDGPTGSGFKLDNPNSPPAVKPLSVQELKAKLDAGETLQLFDVRPENERAIAKLDESRIFDDTAKAHIEGLDNDTELIFICKMGGRSQQVAQYFLSQGYTKVYNVVGGMNAWSVDIDPNMKRY
jgi:monothiol glutaredoxin